MSDINFVYKIAKTVSFGAFASLFQLETQGMEHIPQKGAFILASNHASYFDPPAVGSPLPRDIYYFARKTLFKPGFSNWLLSRLNTIPVDRDGDSDITAFKRVFKVLKDGEGLTLFPEGTRSRDGELQPARPGVGLIMCKAQVPVIPTRIFGSFNALQRGSYLPNWKARMRVVYGSPMLPASYDPGKDHPDRYQEASNRVMAAIANLSIASELHA